MPVGFARYDGLHRVVITFALCYGLIYAGVLVGGQWNYRRGSAFVSAVAPGRALIVEVWPLAILSERFNPYSFGFSSFDPEATDTRWICLWYEDTAAGTRKRLAAFTLPTWPLAKATAGAWLLLCAMEIRRRNGFSSTVRGNMGIA